MLLAVARRWASIAEVGRRVVVLAGVRWAEDPRRLGVGLRLAVEPRAVRRTVVGRRSWPMGHVRMDLVAAPRCEVAVDRLEREPRARRRVRARTCLMGAHRRAARCRGMRRA